MQLIKKNAFKIFVLLIFILNPSSGSAQSTRSFPEDLNGTYNNQGQYAMCYYYIGGVQVGFILAGSSFEFGTNRSNMRVMAKDFDGNTLWTNEGIVYRDYSNIDRAFAISYNPVSDCYLISGYSRSSNGLRDDLALLYIKNDGSPLWYNTYKYNDFNQSPLNSLYGLDLEFNHTGIGTEEFIIVGFHAVEPVNDNLGRTTNSISDKGYFSAIISVNLLGSNMITNKNYKDINSPLYTPGGLNEWSGLNDINYDPTTQEFYVTGSGKYFDPNIIWCINWGSTTVFAKIDPNSADLYDLGSIPPQKMSSYYTLGQGAKGFRSVNQGLDHYILGYYAGIHGFFIIKTDNSGNIQAQKSYFCPTNPLDYAAYFSAYNLFADPSNNNNLVVTGYMSDRGAIQNTHSAQNSNAYPFVVKIDKSTLDPIIPTGGLGTECSYISFTSGGGYWQFPNDHYFQNNFLGGPTMYAPQHSLPNLGGGLTNGVQVACAQKGLNSSCNNPLLPLPPLPPSGLSFYNGQFNNTISNFVGDPGNNFNSDCCLGHISIENQDHGSVRTVLDLVPSGNVTFETNINPIDIRFTLEMNDYCYQHNNLPYIWRKGNPQTSANLPPSISPNPSIGDFQVFTYVSSEWTYEIKNFEGRLIQSGSFIGNTEKIKLENTDQKGIFLFTIDQISGDKKSTLKLDIR